MSGKQTLGLGMRSRNYVQTSCCNGPRTMDTMDAGQGTHPSSFRPYCHIQGGFCVVSASWFSFSGESRSHVCPGKPGKMEAQRGLCLFRMGIPRYRMGYRGSFLVLWEEVWERESSIPDGHRVVAHMWTYAQFLEKGRQRHNILGENSWFGAQTSHSHWGRERGCGREKSVAQGSYLGPCVGPDKLIAWPEGWVSRASGHPAALDQCHWPDVGLLHAARPPPSGVP